VGRGLADHFCLPLIAAGRPISETFSVMKATPKIGKVSSINLVDETSELMVISQFGKIIRIDTKSIRAAGRSTQGVKLLDLERQDKVAAAVAIPPEEAKTQPEEGTLLQ
jgi:DNA gyrase subunit A